MLKEQDVSQVVARWRSFKEPCSNCSKCAGHFRINPGVSPERLPGSTNSGCSYPLLQIPTFFFRVFFGEPVLPWQKPILFLVEGRQIIPTKKGLVLGGGMDQSCWPQGRTETRRFDAPKPWGKKQNMDPQKNMDPFLLPQRPRKKAAQSQKKGIGLLGVQVVLCEGSSTSTTVTPHLFRPLFVQANYLDPQKTASLFSAFVPGVSMTRHPPTTGGVLDIRNPPTLLGVSDT